MANNADLIIARAIYSHLNKWPEKPCPIRLETMDKTPIAFSMAMQQLAGTRILRKYIDGSFKGAWPFAVYVRLAGTDTAKRLDAVATLESLNEWLMTATPPELGPGRVPDEFQMTALPAIAATYEDGSTDYQALFQITYKQRSDYHV